MHKQNEGTLWNLLENATKPTSSPSSYSKCPNISIPSNSSRLLRFRRSSLLDNSWQVQQLARGHKSFKKQWKFWCWRLSQGIEGLLFYLRSCRGTKQWRRARIYCRRNSRLPTTLGSLALPIFRLPFIQKFLIGVSN